MEKTLAIPSDLCRQGALHGLGQWACSYPSQVEQIIDAFLESHGGFFRRILGALTGRRCEPLRRELRRYAQQARAGCVL
jgi:hypothetical protein